MEILIITLTFLLLFIVLVGGASASIPINSCITISSPGEYVLTKDIINSSSTYCIKITSSNVIFDGTGYTIDGVGSWPGPRGVYAYKSARTLTNVTVKNLKVTDWYIGIGYQNVQKGNITNNIANKNKGIGIFLSSSGYNNITGNNATQNTGAGILILSSVNNKITNNNASSNIGTGISLSSSDYNNVTGNNASLNKGTGVSLLSSNNNNITNNNVTSNIGIGILLSSFSNLNNLANNILHNNNYGLSLLYSSKNTIYNNLFNNTNNFNIINSENKWNITKTPGTNIVSGSYFGGNIWINPAGAGFSQTCTDSDGDGICDLRYTLGSKNIDFLPLVYRQYTPFITPPSIISSLPESPVIDVVGATRTFGVTLNQLVNVTWYINGTEVQFNESVTTANYINTSAAAGTWNITAAGFNVNGTALQIWIWKVDTQIHNPGTPANLANTTGNFWVNHTWSSGADTDSFNVSVNGNWDNSSNAFFRNTSSISHGWVNISVAGYNSASNLLSGFVSQDTRIPNNPISITDIQDSYSLNEGQTLTIDANYSDADGDTGTFARNFSKGTFDTSTGILSWTAGADDAGVHNWQINVTDGYGSIFTKMFMVTVTTASASPPKITSFSPSSPVSNNPGEARIFSITANQTVNVSWLINGTEVFNQSSITQSSYTNTSAALGAWNIIAIVVNENGSGRQTWVWTVGHVPTAGDSISGMKFNDLNGNGTRDIGEPGLANWTIVLTRPDGSNETTITNSDGAYMFRNLSTGNYTVAEVLVPGWIQTLPAAPGIYYVTLATGENATGKDFGNNLMSLPSGVNASREIEEESLLSGNSTNITVRISSDMIQAWALQESIPAGWNLTRISDDADGFKNSTNEWVWSNVTPGITKTVIYTITAPTDAAIGTYYINGTISNSSGVIAVVGGSNIITLDILAYYRRLGSDPNIVETMDLLKAMDDWRSGTAPAGFINPITKQELLALINEWAMS